MILCGWIQKKILIPDDPRTWPGWVARHVARCDGCRAFVERATAVKRLLAEEPAPAPDEVEIERIMRRVQAVAADASRERQAAPWSTGELFEPRWGLRLALAAAVIMILVVHFVNAPTPSGSQNEEVAEALPSATVGAPGPVAPSPHGTPSMASPVFVVVRPPLAQPVAWEATAAASNGGAGVEFGGLPVMPVSFDY